MFSGNIFGRQVELQGSPYTLLVFKNEFGEDFVTFLAEQYSQIQNGEIDIECWLRIAWALCRTHDDKIDYYERWLEQFDPNNFDLKEQWEVFSVINSAVNAEMFREKTPVKIKLLNFITRLIYR